MSKTNLVVLGDNDNLIHQGIIPSLKDSPEYVIIYVNGKDVLDEEAAAAISNELEDLGIISKERDFSTGVYDADGVVSLNVPDDVSDNKQIGRKHNKPFYQKGRW